MIVELIQRLARLDPAPSAEEIADALWLAQQLRQYGEDVPARAATEPEPAAVPPEPAEPDEPAPRPAPPPATGPGTSQPRPGPQAGLYVAAGETPGASSIRTPGVPAISRALPLARALRPLRITAPSPTRRKLDEAATARRFAETGVWEPVTVPSPERRLDLAVVLDSSSSMQIWQRTATELQTILVQLGAFRDVRVWRLNADDDRLLLRRGAGSGRSPDELIDPTHRRVILVVSDCIGTAWQNGRFAVLLERWARSGPVAILQPLPQRLWWRSGAATEPVTFRALAGGLPNDRLAVRPLEPKLTDLAGPVSPSGVAIPVLELEPRWLLPWAKTVAAGGQDTRGVVLFTGNPIAGELQRPSADGIPPLERVRRFRAASSPTAFKLAGYLAAAPLRLPVMRLVQAAMLPESTPAHLAEVFLGDLLRQADPRSSAGPEEREYEFHEGVRAVLLSSLRRDEALGVLRAVWDVIRSRLGSSLDFRALLAAIADGTSGLSSDQQFAQVAAQVLTQVGGRYGKLAKQLTNGNAIWSGLPPRNPDFTGRDDLLARIGERLEEGPIVLLPGGPGGEGKSQLAAEYAYRHADDYDLVWWIPAEHPTQVRSALAALARRLDLPQSENLQGTLNELWSALRAGRPSSRWLLIYDHAGDPGQLRPLMPVDGSGPRIGHVLITSSDKRWGERESAEGIEPMDVGPFTRPESVSLLRRRTPSLTPEQAGELAGLVNDLPVAVDQAAIWQSVTNGGVLEYVRLYEAELAELAEAELPDELPVEVATGLSLMIDWLSAENPAAAALLSLWTWFGREPVTEDLLLAGRPAAVPSASGPTASLLAMISEVLADRDRLRSAMSDLSGFWLARYDEQNHSLQGHRMVRALLRSKYDEVALTALRDYVHAILAASTPEGKPRANVASSRRAAITPHVLPASVVDGSTAEAREVLLDQAQYLYVFGDFEGSKELAELARSQWMTESGPDDRQVLQAGRALANARRALGEMQGLTELSEETLRLMERHPAFGREHPDTLFTASGYAADLRLEGRFQEAYRRDAQTWRAMNAQEDPSLVDLHLFANNLGIDLRLLGRFDEARTRDAAAHGWLVGQSATFPLDLFRATHHLARDLHALGDYQGALRLQRSSLADISPMSPDHTMVLQAKVSHASALRKSGEFEEADRLAAETSALHVRRFGQEHPNTLASRCCEVLTSTALGDAERGRRLSAEALEAYQRVIGEQHPFVHVCAAGLAVTLRALGDTQAACDVDQAALTGLQAALGPDHYYALCVSVGLAQDLYLLGDVRSAVDMSAAALGRFREHYGADHPYALACEHNHHVITAGDSDALDRLVRVLGPGHPDVLKARSGAFLECDIEPSAV